MKMENGQIGNFRISAPPEIEFADFGIKVFSVRNEKLRKCKNFPIVYVQFYAKTVERFGSKVPRVAGKVRECIFASKAPALYGFKACLADMGGCAEGRIGHFFHFPPNGFAGFDFEVASSSGMYKCDDT